MDPGMYIVPLSETCQRERQCPLPGKPLTLAALHSQPPREGHVLLVGDWHELSASALRLAYELTLCDAPLTCSLLLGHRKREADGSIATSRDPEAAWSGQAAILNYMDLEEASGQDWRVLGRLASAKRVRDALIGPAVLLVATHGDGLDARLPGGLHFCPAPWTNGDPDSRKAPACVKTGSCYWTHERFHSPELEEQLVVPQQVSARTIILDSCLGLQSGESLFDASQLLACSLVESGACEELICFSGYQIEDGQRLLDMSHALAAGASPELTVKEYNRSACSQAIDRRAFLVHGNSLRLRVAGGDVLPKIRSRVGPEPPPSFAGGAPDLARFLGECLPTLGDDRVRTQLDLLLKADLPVRDRMEKLADLLIGVDTASLWSGRPEVARTSEATQCPVCGNPLSALQLDHAGFERKCSACHACNYLSDDDGSLRAEATLDDEGLVSVGNLRPGAEVRIRIAPAGCPKYPLSIHRLDEPLALFRPPAVITGSTAFSFRAGTCSPVLFDFRQSFYIPPYFLSVLVLDELGYRSETFTVRAREGFIRTSEDLPGIGASPGIPFAQTRHAC